MGNVYMEAKDINYRGGQKKMSVEEALKNTSGEAAAIAQLQQDVIDLNDVKANKITIAPAFSAEESYDPGDLVYYNGLTYRCVNAHEGEWDADDFSATTIDNELAELRSGLIDRVLNGSNVTKVEIELVQNASNYFPAINLYTSDSTYYQVIWNTSTDVNKLSCNYFDGTNWTTIAEK